MSRLRAVLVLVVVAGLLWAHHALGLSLDGSLERLRALVAAHAPYGPLAFVGACVVGIVLQLPPLVPIAAGGVLFETGPAIAYGWVAAVIGTTATFLVVRHLARDLVQSRLVGRFGRLQALDHRLARHGFWTVFLLRLLLCLAPPLTWALGASRVRVHHYLAGTALGVVPGVSGTVFLAGTLAEGGAGASWSAEAVLGSFLVVVLALVAVLAGRRLLAGPPAPGATRA